MKTMLAAQHRVPPAESMQGRCEFSFWRLYPPNPAIAGKACCWAFEDNV